MWANSFPFKYHFGRIKIMSKYISKFFILLYYVLSVISTSTVISKLNKKNSFQGIWFFYIYVTYSLEYV